MRQIKDLEERINRLGGDHINKDRRPFYRYTHKGLDQMQNEAWRWYVEMQLSSLEIAEIRSNNKQRRELGYASVTQPNPPEKIQQDRVLYDRYVALLESGELRAEQILEHNSADWVQWLGYFESTVWPELQKPIQDEIHEDEREEYYWDFKLRYMDAWKASREG
jgi:hypothetical protein